MERPLALVVDGNGQTRASVRSALAEAGIEVLEAEADSEALEILRTRPVRMLFVTLPAVSTDPRSALVDRAVRLSPSVVPVALCDEPSGSDAVRAVRAGAFDVVGHPPDPVRLRLVAQRALAQHELLEERRLLREQIQNGLGYQRLVGRSEAMERIRERVERLAGTELRILLLGEAGTGKRLAAKTLHLLSPRREKSFVLADCTGGPAQSLEAELFGRERGSYPGGERRTAGLLESASGGTLLLHELADLPLDLQDRLLRAVQDGWTTRVGGGERIPLDVRFLASSSRDVARFVEGERLLRDLYNALAGATVELPRLRDRLEDVPVLARHFVEEIRSINDLPPLNLAPETVDVLCRHAWPGNVRELRTAMEQAVILAAEGTILPRNLPESVRQDGEPVEGPTPAAARFRDAKKQVVESFEKRYLEGLLERHHGNVTAAAMQAGMLRSALQRLLRKYEIRSSEFRRGRREKTAP